MAISDGTLAEADNGFPVDSMNASWHAAEELARLGLSVGLFQKDRHALEQRDRRDGGEDDGGGAQRAMARWRQKERIKTQAAALVLCLNVGVDPPDVIRVSPCARLECWVDPDPLQAVKSTETIGKTLQSQYERWQPKAKYKLSTDPTMDEVKRLCSETRRTARSERTLFHYNGHGVPRPTSNGEIWVFNRNFTQYIPVSIYDLATWLGLPAIYVVDCSHAGIVLDCLKNFVRQAARGPGSPHGRVSPVPSGSSGTARGGPALEGRLSTSGSSSSAGDPMREIIVLAACGAREMLPQDSDLCADIFTACLTTPIKVAMRWSLSRGLLQSAAITQSAVDRIPGRQTDRKTMLGELNWIFTSITDTIAWNVLPRAVFQKLFRQDLLVASLFRNFMLAERILKACGCQPVSQPRLPPMHQHPLWESWDLTAEAALRQLTSVLADETSFRPSAFFEDQLTAFELWLRHSGATPQSSPPQQLPIVLQVLLSQVHRLRALRLLGHFLSLGPWSVQLALSVGIFPYVLKLLQSSMPTLRASLVFIWSKILASDRACQQDLVKDDAHEYFLSVLREGGSEGGAAAADEGAAAQCRTQAVFVLAMICLDFPVGQRRCDEGGLLELLVSLTSSQRDVISQYAEGGHGYHDGAPEALAQARELLTWCLLALGCLCDDQPPIVGAAIREHGLHWRLKEVLDLPLDPEARAAAVFALGRLIDTGLRPVAAGPRGGPEAEPYAAECEVLGVIAQRAFDGSTLVRCEVAAAIARAACMPPTATLKRHAVLFQAAFEAQQRRVWSAFEDHRAAVSTSPALGPSGHHRGRLADSSGTLQTMAVAAMGAQQPAGAPGEGGPVHSPFYTRVAHSDGAVTRAGPGDRGRWTLPGVDALDAPAARGEAEKVATQAGRAATTSYEVDRYSLPQGRQSHGPGSPDVSRVVISEEGPGAASEGAPRAGAERGGLAPPMTSSSSSASTALDVPLDRAGSGGGQEGAGASSGVPPSLALHSRIVDILGILATDPAPIVAHYGRLTLHTSGHEVTPLPPASAAGLLPGAPTRGSSLQSATLSASFAAGQHMSPGAALSRANVSLVADRSLPNSGVPSVASTQSAAERSGRWAPGWGALFRMPRMAGGGGSKRGTAAPHERSAHGGGAVSRAHSVAGVPSATSPASVTTPILRGAGAGQTAARLKREACVITPMHESPLELPTSTARGGAASGVSDSPGAARPFGGEGASTAGGRGPASTQLPESVVLRLLTHRFQEPTTAAAGHSSPRRDEGGHRGGVTRARAAYTSSRSHALALRKIESAAAARARDLAHFSVRRDACEAAERPKLSEQVQTLETYTAQGCTAIVHHASDDIVTCADVHGVVHAIDASGAHGNPTSYHLNCYDACTGVALEPSERSSTPAAASTCTIVALYVINELESPTVMAAAADGAVRVWDRHLERGEQRLVAAWQSVDIEGTSFSWQGPSSYLFHPQHGLLFASGGSTPHRIFVWDLQREHNEGVLEQFEREDDVPTSFYTPFLTGALEAPPLVLAGGSDGVVRIFDLRMAGPASTLRPHIGALAGLAYRQSSGVLASASAGAVNELHFSDVRKLGQGSAASPTSDAVFKRELAHNTGRITHVAAHPTAPLFASASDRQVVKIWQQNGDMLSSIRAQPLAASFQAGQPRLGRTSCIAFAPFDLKLALGAGDSLCSVYRMEYKGAAGSGPPSRAATPSAADATSMAGN